MGGRGGQGARGQPVRTRASADIIQPALHLGLVDHVCVILEPALSGTGVRSFGAADHPGINAFENVAGAGNVASLTKTWSYATGGTVDSSPAVANGPVYVGSDDDSVYAFVPR